MRKYIKYALGAFVLLAVVSMVLNMTGMAIKGLTQLSIILLMAVLIVSLYCDIKEGKKEKSSCITIIIIAVLAIVVNVISAVMEFMGV